MSAPRLPDPPAGPLLRWVIENPAQVTAYLETVRALGKLEISVTQSGVTKKFPLILSGENAVISIQL